MAFLQQLVLAAEARIGGMPRKTYHVFNGVLSYEDLSDVYDYDCTWSLAFVNTLSMPLLTWILCGFLTRKKSLPLRSSVSDTTCLNFVES